MNYHKNREAWIGVVALVIIAGLGFWWLTTISPGAASLNGANTATTSAATSSRSVQQPQAVNRTYAGVASIAENIPSATEFASLLSASGVASQLKGPGPYTVFVPTDGAFSELPSGTISKLSAAGKKRLVEYSIVPGRAINVSAESAGSIQALSGDALNFSFGTDNIPMVNSAILITEYKASNGVVYLIDNVLIPPSSTQLPL